MNNADMPAIANGNFIDTHNTRKDGLDESGRYLIANGLTKREMMAMQIHGHLMSSLNAGASNGEWEHPSYEEVAEQTVLCVDALLKELEK